MKRQIVFVLLLVGVTGSSASGLSFKQVAYFPSGLRWSVGYIKGGDFNHDGIQDLVFTTVLSNPTRQRIIYYGCLPYNRYVLEDSVSSANAFWDIGNLDGDSLKDLVSQKNSFPGGITVWEPGDYWSFPKYLVWSWNYEYIGNSLQPMYITDLDQDGLKEILTADAQVIYVFENRGNNQYQKVFSDTVRTAVPSGSFAFGDFDGDGWMEFAFSSYGGPDTTVYVYKCTGNDQYQKVWGEHLNAWNMYDCVTSPDLDGDGKLEFFIGDCHNGAFGLTGGLWVYEATGINQYALIYTDSVTGLNDRGVYCVHSDCGDIDRDGKPELVWAIDRDWMVYKSPGNNQFQRVFSAYGDNGHNSTNIHINDMNGNGYPEIIESGGNETHIWEVEAAQVVYPNGGETLYWDSSCVIRFRNVAPFQADSFSLFFSSDSGLSYSPIARGIPGSDSTYLWMVPHVTSSNCFVMLWAYQNATGWDFSDGPFTIQRASGVEVFPPHASRLTPYVVSPNPFLSHATIPGHEAVRFALYDVSGRKVGVYKGDKIGFGLSAGIYFLRPEGQNAKLLRIVKLR